MQDFGVRLRRSLASAEQSWARFQLSWSPNTIPRPLQPGRGHCADRPGEVAWPHPVAVSRTGTLSSTRGAVHEYMYRPLLLVDQPTPVTVERRKLADE